MQRLTNRKNGQVSLRNTLGRRGGALTAGGLMAAEEAGSFITAGYRGKTAASSAGRDVLEHYGVGGTV